MIRNMLRVWLIWAVLSTANVLAASGWVFNDNSAVYKLPDGQVTLSAQGDSSVYVHYQPDGITQLPGLALAAESDQLLQRIKQTPEYTEFRHGALKVVVKHSPFRLSFYRDNQLLIAEEVGMFAHQTMRGFRFSIIDGEQFYGAGQRVLGMDRRGHRLPLYNRAHYGYTTESTQMNYSLPAVMSSNHYAVIFDNSAKGYIDIGATEPDVLQFEAVSGRTAYLVSAASSQIELVKEVVTVTGKQPLPPRWALGNFASRFGYRTEQQTRDVVAAYAEQDIPLDAVVLDLYWFGKEVQGEMGNLNWDRDAFPTAEQMVADFTEQGVNTILITEPFILTTSSQYEAAKAASALGKNLAGEVKTFDFYFGNTGLVDVFDPSANDWFWQYYANLMEQGVTGWWGDLGEPEVHPHDLIHNWQGKTVTADEVHNAYGDQWAKMVYEKTLETNPNQRPFILMRSGFVGSQRYGLIPWTGDVSRSWGGLVPQVELNLQMGVFGLAYTHSDLGGFAGGEVFDPELYVRWLQLGVFSPIFRPHAQEDIAPEPIFHPEPVKAMARDLIKLRYQLLPYNYSLAMENSLTGMPLARPLSFVDSAPNWFTHKDSFMWGDAFLMAPVTSAEITEQSVMLPSGVWFDYFSGQRFEGSANGTKVSVDVTLPKFPLFVKAGSFVPMTKANQTTKDYRGETLVVHYWHDKTVSEASYQLLEDDGQSPQSLAGNQWGALNFVAKVAENKLTINVTETGDYPSKPTRRAIRFVVHGLKNGDHTVDATATHTQLNGAKVEIPLVR